MKNTTDTDATQVELALKEKMQALFDTEFDITLLNLCTADGFSIHALSRGNDIESDKVAAIASTLCSISNASAEQISKGRFNIATVESMNGLLLFLRTQFQDRQSVLCVATNSKMSLGNARFHSQRLVNEIEEIG